MKLKRFRNKFISMLLTLAMLLTLFPTAVFAEDTAADRPASAEFKIMGLYALRDNGRRVSFFSYESRDNAFLTKANMTYPDSWFKLIYVIERSQPVTLELYEMKDEPAYMDEDIVSMPYAPEDDADGHGKLQSEEFLGRRLGVLVGVPVQENIVPLQEGDDIYTAEQVGYSPIDEDEWLNIVYQTIRGKRQPKVIEDFYAFGFECVQHGFQLDWALHIGQKTVLPARGAFPPQQASRNRSRYPAHRFPFRGLHRCGSP